MLHKKTVNMGKKLKTGAVVIILGTMLCACGKEKEVEMTESTETEVSEAASAESESAEAESTETEASEAGSVEEEDSEASGAEKKNTEAASSVSAESGTEIVEGMIGTMGENIFSIQKIETTIVEGGFIEVNETNEPCEISYSENTRFILCKVISGDNNSSKSSESATTKESLAKDTMVKVTGSKTEKGVSATEIIIYQFQ